MKREKNSLSAGKKWWVPSWGLAVAELKITEDVEKNRAFPELWGISSMLHDKKEFWGEGSRRNTQLTLDWGCLDASRDKQEGVLGSTLKTKEQSGTEAREMLQEIS